MGNQFFGNKLSGQQGFEHGRKPLLGILVVNLGTPDAPTPAAVRRYLAEFLSDSRVVEIPKLIWKLILHGIILRTRPAKSAKAYQKVWLEDGSPLMVTSSQLVDEMSKELATRLDTDFKIELAMRYGQPSIDNGLKTLEAAGAERIIVLPLYPQYSGATIGSVADAVFKSLMKWRWVPEVTMMGAYHDNPQYISAVAESIRDHWSHEGQSDKLLMSFHGMPKATLMAGDPYYCHCHKTARLIAEQLQLKENQWEMAFQSRFGAATWLQPYVSQRLTEMPTEGVKKLSVVCPGFAVDCLETLEEIAMQGHDDFLAAGGESFEYIPALNTSSAHVAMLVNKVMEHAVGVSTHENITVNNNATQPDQSRHLALAAGASK